MNTATDPLSGVRLLNAEQCARYIGLDSTDALDQMVSRDEIPESVITYLSPRRRRFDRAALDLWIESKKHGGLTHDRSRKAVGPATPFLKSTEVNQW